MKLITPAYYDKFVCSADKCSDNCCVGWEIDIDEETALLYGKTEGGFGKKLKENITASFPKSFILKGERCPFLNGNNLCEIIINMGEDFLCQICRDHPRFFEWYGDIKEGGIGLCCEEGARLILESEAPLDFCEKEIPFEDGGEIDAELFSQLLFARKEIFRCLTDKKHSLYEKTSAVLNYAEKVQFLIDNYAEVIPEISFGENEKNESDIMGILDSYSSLEPVDENWEPYLKGLKENADKAEKEKALTEKHRINLLVYFIYRYFLKGTFDGEILSKVKFAFVSTAFIELMYKHKRQQKPLEDFEDIVKSCVLYSKQTEYSQENLDLIRDMTYEKECYGTKKIISLFI